MKFWTDEPQTMRRAYQEICEGEDPWVALGNFTNDFFDDPDERQTLVQEPLAPWNKDRCIDEGTLQRWAVFCVASVQYLCEKYHIPVPSWVNDPQYVPLAKPWYHSPMALQKPSVKASLEATTPEIFKQKNIYCGDRIYLNKREEAEKLRRLMSA